MSKTDDDVIGIVKSDMSDTVPRAVVEIVVAAAHDISRRFIEKAADKKSHDLLFAALAPELVLGSMLSRSATSLMGSQFYPRLATGLARLRYGEEAVPRNLISPSVKKAGLSVSQRENPPGHDVYIHSAYDQRAVDDGAIRLQKLIKVDRRLRIGMPDFDSAFLEALDKISKKPYAQRVWPKPK